MMEGGGAAWILRKRLTQTCSDDDGNDGAELHGEATGWRDQGDTVTQVAHDVVTIRPETDGNTNTTKGENPDRHLGLLLRNLA